MSVTPLFFKMPPFTLLPLNSNTLYLVTYLFLEKGVCVCVCVCVYSVMSDSLTPWAVDRQSPL